MISAYYHVYYTQDYIAEAMNRYPFSQDDLVNFFEDYLGKTSSYVGGSQCTWNNVLNEINHNRPYASLISSPYHHARVCRGYSDTGYGIRYLAINDPLPVGSGTRKFENFGNEYYQVFAR